MIGVVVCIIIQCVFIFVIYTILKRKINNIDDDVKTKIDNMKEQVKQYSDCIGMVKDGYQQEFMLLQTLKQMNRGTNRHTQMLQKLIILLQNYSNKQSYQYQVLVVKLSKQLKQHIRLSKNYNVMLQSFIKLQLQKAVSSKVSG